MMAIGQERRKESRCHVQCDVVQELVTVGVTEEVSLHGVRLIGLVDYALGREARLHVELDPSRLIPVQGIVAWRASGDDGIRVGLRIDRPAQAWVTFVKELEGQRERQGVGEEKPLRSAPRFSAIIPARYGLRAAEEEDCVLLDVSPGGVQLQGPVAPPAGSSVFVKLDTPEYGRFQLLGRVVWRSAEGDYPRVGLRLDAADEAYYRMLSRLSAPERRRQAVMARAALNDDLVDGVETEIGDALLIPRD